MIKNNAKTFELDGITYERKDSGYCFRDNARIRAEVFEAAEREFDAREAAEAAKAREIEGVREDINPTFDVDGHHYVHDWANRKHYRDGEAISKRQWESEVFGEGAPKPARKRRPKDVAAEFETTEGAVTLTAKQVDFLREVAQLGEDDLLGGLVTGCWCDVLCDAIGGQFAGKPMTVGAMLSTLCEKGLGERSKEERETDKGRTRKVTSFCLTDLGRQVWTAMGLR